MTGVSDESPGRLRVAAYLAVVAAVLIVVSAGAFMLYVATDRRPHNCLGYSTDAYCPGAKTGGD
jgi:hypothetical protein